MSFIFNYRFPFTTGLVLPYQQENQITSVLVQFQKLFRLCEHGSSLVARQQAIRRSPVLSAFLLCDQCVTCVTVFRCLQAKGSIGWKYSDEQHTSAKNSEADYYYFTHTPKVSFIVLATCVLISLLKDVRVKIFQHWFFWDFNHCKMMS